jgi:hypothetical protein
MSSALPEMVTMPLAWSFGGRGASWVEARFLKMSKRSRTSQPERIPGEDVRAAAARHEAHAPFGPADADSLKGAARN